ncbi:MAG TPA: sugar transferase [Chitinophagaceae bacterium]|nr:sugar transferase [Chitinophagaceae bacterium]
MRFSKKIETWWYMLSDALAALIAWALFLSLRRELLLANTDYRNIPVHLPLTAWFSFCAISIGWVILFYISGTYSDPYQKSRIMEFFQTFIKASVGCVILFFLLLLDHPPMSHEMYYREFFLLLGLQFLATFAGRLFLLQVARYQLVRGLVRYNTLIIGASQAAIRLHREISQQKGLGYHVTGFIYPDSDGKNGLGSYLPNLGSIDMLERIVDQNQVQQVILAMEKPEKHRLVDIINRLSGKEVILKVIPDMYDILSGSVRMNNVYGAVLTEIRPGLMSEWQEHLKRLVDVFGATIGLILLSPLMAYAAIRVKFSSPGPVLYSQERVGLKGRVFRILKFRSMYRDAEPNGPALCTPEDPRVTRWGREMRKWRMDELPQLWNILRGEMSFVGPRPERRFYIDGIMERNRVYGHLLKVKPGLTSWGMVKFGYAENLDQMIERMKYDLIYLENISLGLDFKIMTHTLLTILRKQGR